LLLQAAEGWFSILREDAMYGFARPLLYLPIGINELPPQEASYLTPNLRLASAGETHKDDVVGRTHVSAHVQATETPGPPLSL